MSLFTRATILFSTFAIILVCLFFLYSNFFVKKSFETQIFSNLRTIAEAKEHTYLAFVEGLKIRTLDWSTDSEIRALAEDVLNPKLSPRDRDQARELFARYMIDIKMKADQSVLIAEVIDDKGIVAASTYSWRIGMNEGMREYSDAANHFSRAITSSFGEVFSSGALFDIEESEKPMLHIMTRIFSNKQDASGDLIPLNGILLLQFVAFDGLEDLTKNPALLEKYESNTKEGSPLKDLGILKSYLVNKDGKIIYKSGDVDQSQIITGKLLDYCVERGEELVLKYLAQDGTKVLAASSCIEDEKLTIISEIPEESAYAAFVRLLRTSLFLWLSVIGVLILVIYGGVKRLLRRIDIITDLSKEISNGNFGARLPNLGNDEIGHLGGVFNQMLDTITQSKVELEQLSRELKKQLEEREHDILEHEDQKKFADQSRRATLNLLEDAWKTKEKLESESRRLEAVLGAMGAGLLLIDREYKIKLINARIERNFGIQKSELLGADLRTILSLSHADTKPISLTEWPTEKMFLTGTSVVTTLADRLYITTPKRLVPLPVIITVTPFKSIGSLDGVQEAVVVIRDATEELALDDVKSGFISVASHQLRTPLTTIRWYSEMLLEEATDALTRVQQDFLREINDGAKRLYQTIDLLLSISRVEGGKTKIDRQPIDLGIFTHEVFKELEPQINQKNLLFSAMPCAQGVGVVRLDPLVLRQVLLNLFSNAIRYTPKGGSVEACWEIVENPRQIVYSVKDTGMGIPQDQQSRIFTKFFRAENAMAEVPDGTGLGLPLVKELVEAWGGEIRFSSLEGRGSTFTFTIPLTTNPDNIVEKDTHGTMTKSIPESK